jgi:co-chaperonin GroES (HSP10)
MSVNVTPLHDRVLVRRLEEKETAKGGIIIPDTAKEKPHEGEVMAVGAGKIEKGKRVPLDVKVKNARVAAGLTQTAVARQLARPQSFVSKCESGERRVDVIELQEFARLYGKHFVLLH